MKRCLVLLSFLAACGPDSDRPPATGACGPMEGGEGAYEAPIPAGTLLALTTDFMSGALQAIGVAAPHPVSPELMLASGDPVLRRLGDQAVIINRGNSSNLLVVTGGLEPGLQIALGACGPHDVEVLDDCRALVTCFEEPRLKIARLDTGEVEDGPDLSPFADADGIPEMDQLARVGDRIFVSLELLDRNAYFVPSGPGLVVVLDAATLEVVDVDAESEGVQGYPLCTNPYTDFAAAPDGRLYVACSGSYVAAGAAALVVLDPATGEVEVRADEATLGGPPSGLRVDASGTAFVLVAAPNAWEPTEMRVVAVSATGVETIHARAGFSLSGLALDGEGTLYVGSRENDASMGVWILPAAGGPVGPIRTSLPPLELEVF